LGFDEETEALRSPGALVGPASRDGPSLCPATDRHTGGVVLSPRSEATLTLQTAKRTESQARWLTPVIPATREAEIRRMAV
jgi:hypothetical protein